MAFTDTIFLSHISGFLDFKCVGFVTRNIEDEMVIYKKKTANKDKLEIIIIDYKSF